MAFFMIVYPGGFHAPVEFKNTLIIFPFYKQMYWFHYELDVQQKKVSKPRDLEGKHVLLSIHFLVLKRHTEHHLSMEDPQDRRL